MAKRRHNRAMPTDEHIVEALAANLTAALAERGWSQAELARRSGEPLMQVSKMVRGTQQIRLAAVVRVARALEVPVDTLIDAEATAV